MLEKAMTRESIVLMNAATCALPTQALNLGSAGPWQGTAIQVCTSYGGIQMHTQAHGLGHGYLFHVISFWTSL